MTATPRWVSSKCVHRTTQDLRERWAHEPDTWISSTGRSAAIDIDDLVAVNRDTGYRRVIPTQLTFHEESAQMEHLFSIFAWPSYRFHGTVGNTAVWTRTDSGAFGWQTDL